MTKITILVGPGGQHPNNFMVHQVAIIWRAQGHDVRVIAGADLHEHAAFEADIAINHIDLTYIPRAYHRIFRHYETASGRPVINGQVLDISKRFISRNLVARGDGYDGPVIVKTNLNYGGAPETSVKRRLGRGVHAARRHLPWSLRASLKPTDYRVFDTLKEVPAAAWFNRNLVIEKYFEQKSGGMYKMSVWIFFGSREINNHIYANDPIVKGENIVKIETGDPNDVPQRLRDRRNELGFDIGKFDYVMADGAAVLIDANRTPGGLPDDLKRYDAGAEFFAEGLGDFV